MYIHKLGYDRISQQKVGKLWWTVGNWQMLANYGRCLQLVAEIFFYMIFQAPFTER